MGGDFLDFWIEQAKLDYYLAMMHEHFGNRSEALSFYQKAVRKWRGADKEYPPYVDARQRLANLTK